MTPAIELLRIQLEGSLDARGRIRDCYGVTIAVAESNRGRGESPSELWIGDEVPDDLAAQLVAVFERAGSPDRVAPSPPDRTAPPADRSRPPVLDACLRLAGDVGLAMGPSYVIPDDAVVSCDVAIVSGGSGDNAGIDRLRGANPGNWDPVEWDELLDGRLGPWAIVIVDGEAVSVCHTPGPMTARKAECGVWTDPRYRGRGYAAATAAAWVPLVRASNRHLFYSTDADNRSSQRVADRLGARQIGWTWRAHRPRQATRRLHPLCSLMATVNPTI